MVSPQAIRRGIMTASITIITATGAVYGAGLKSNYEAKQKRKELQVITPDEVIAKLEVARSGLFREKTELEIKIAKFSARIDQPADRNAGVE